MGKIGVCPLERAPIFKKVKRADMKARLEKAFSQVSDELGEEETEEKVESKPKPKRRRKPASSKAKTEEVQKEADSEKETETAPVAETDEQPELFEQDGQ